MLKFPESLAISEEIAAALIARHLFQAIRLPNNPDPFLFSIGSDATGQTCVIMTQRRSRAPKGTARHLLTRFFPVVRGVPFPDASRPPLSDEQMNLIDRLAAEAAHDAEAINDA